MCTYKVGTQQRRRWLATFDIAIHNLYKDRTYILSYLFMFQFRIKSNTILMLVLWLYKWDFESVNPNRKLNLKTWWICFSFKRIGSTNRNNTGFYQDSAHSRVTKGRTVYANEPQFILYTAQRTNVNFYSCYCCRYVLYLSLLWRLATVEKGIRSLLCCLQM